MSNIDRLAAIVASAAKKTDRIERGRISGSTVVVNGRTYNPIWGGDFDVAHGDRADCVIDGSKCIVLRCSR